MQILIFRATLHHFQYASHQSNHSSYLNRRPCTAFFYNADVQGGGGDATHARFGARRRRT